MLSLIRCLPFDVRLKLTGMSENALRDLNTIPGAERKNEGSSKACLTKPSVDNAGENDEEWQKKKSCASLDSPSVNGNQAVTADSGGEIGIVEVEYIESENLSDLENIETCLEVICYPSFGSREGFDS